MSFIKEKSKQDYTIFKDYCESFKLHPIGTDINQEVRIIHKQLFNVHFYNFCTKNQNQFMKESVSDLLSVMLLSRIGAHKAAMIMLRSCVENFVRYLVDTYLNKPELIQSTHILPLFEQSKLHFKDLHQIITDHINKLYSIYSFLCSYSHSALPNFQENHVSLQELTSINKEELRKTSKETEKVVNSMLCILYYCYYNVDSLKSYNLEPDNRNEFIELVPSEIYTYLPVPL